VRGWWSSNSGVHRMSRSSGRVGISGTSFTRVVRCFTGGSSGAAAGASAASSPWGGSTDFEERYRREGWTYSGPDFLTCRQKRGMDGGFEFLSRARDSNVVERIHNSITCITALFLNSVNCDVP
jgi:hypothetical protein